ncbi:MAG: LLM class flavin-dependent oxidoreductase [Gordonia sp. (in: high G+C Gram-positive bacteria)]
MRPLDLPVGLTVGHASEPFLRSIELAEQVEAAGLDFVSVGDAGSEAFALLGALAVRTRRIGLMSGIATWSRSPLTTAMAAKTVHNLSAGRFLLGVGPMPRNWATEWHGLSYDPVVGRMREYLRAVRACLDATPEHPADLAGQYFPVKAYPGHAVTPERRVPIALSATLPAMTRLAAELTDAVMLNTIQPWDWVTGPGRELVDEGLARGGRPRTSLEVGIMRFCAIHDDPAVAYDRVRRSIAFYYGIPYFRPLLAPFGFGKELDAGERALASGDRSAVIASVSDRMVDAIGIAGTADQVVERLEAYRGHVDWVQVSTGPNLPAGTAREQGERLVQVLGAARRASLRPGPWEPV